MSKSGKRETYVIGNVEKLTQIAKVEGNVTIHTEVSNAIKYDESLSRARNFLAIGAHPQAREVLDRCLQEFPLDEQVHLLFALASLGRDYAKRFDDMGIQAIENHLQVARAKPTLTTYFVATVALAVIRKDYYEIKCIAAPHLPTFEELASEIRSIVASPMDIELLKHLKTTIKARNALKLRFLS